VLVFLQALAVQFLVSLCSVEPAAELKCLFLIFLPILAPDGNILLLDKHPGRGGTGCVIRPRAFLLRALKARTLLGTTVQALEIVALPRDVGDIFNHLLAVDDVDVGFRQV
jgi:hypothetical protein